MMKANESIKQESFYDAVIIGGGPAGLTAAIYLSRASYRVLVLEKEQFGGQITITNEVVNYPGIKSISGKELTEAMQAQAESFGAEFLQSEAIGLELSGDIKTVKTNAGDFQTFAVLIATGAHPRTVGFKGEEEFKGRGVAYCATCDGEFFSGREIFVIGGGYAAAEESVFLTKFGRHITIIMRKEDFSCAASVAEEAKSNEKITILTNTVLEEVSGENGIQYIRCKNTKSGEATEYRTAPDDSFGVFVFAGYSPNTQLLDGIVELDEQGYVITDSSQKTSANGVYAAGDVCIKPLRQVVTATGDGALAATQIEKFVAQMQRETGLRPKRAERKAVKQEHFTANEASDAFTPEIVEQIKGLFSKAERKLTLKLYLDSRDASAELESFTARLCEITDKLDFEVVQRNADSSFAPCVKVFAENKGETGLAFHGIPGGHEFTSFILGLYNAAGSGQPIDAATAERIRAIDKKVDLKILVSLSCTMCPDTVIACQRIAAENGSIRAEAYDINHFPQLREKYNVMSVPCLVIDDKKVSFGKKSIDAVLSLITQP